jgi:hypothetical protein
LNLWVIAALGFYIWATLVVLGLGLRQYLGALIWYFLFPAGLLLVDFLGFGVTASFTYHNPTTTDFCVYGAAGVFLFEFFFRDLAPDLEQLWMSFFFRLASLMPWFLFLFLYVAPRFLTYPQAREAAFGQCLWVLLGGAGIQVYLNLKRNREIEAGEAIISVKRKPQGKAKS